MPRERSRRSTHSAASCWRRGELRPIGAGFSGEVADGAFLLLVVLRRLLCVAGDAEASRRRQPCDGRRRVTRGASLVGRLRALVCTFRVGVCMARGTVAVGRVMVAVAILALHGGPRRCEGDRCRVTVDARARDVPRVKKVHRPRMRVAPGHRHRHRDLLRGRVILGAVAGCAPGLRRRPMMTDGAAAWRFERQATVPGPGLMTREARELRRVPRVGKAVGHGGRSPR